VNDRVQELIEDLRRRATSCDEVANNYDRRRDSFAAERCRAKAQAYLHSADLAQQILGTEPERDAEYWCMRCPVTEQDVSDRGVTTEQAAAWMESNGFERAYAHRTLVLGTDAIACLCNNAGKRVGKPAQHVLDEMAAIVPEAKP
jgi:hypothetical protein